jgi:hypothetical protein
VILLEADTVYKLKSLEIRKPIKIVGKAGSVIILSRGSLLINIK